MQYNATKLDGIVIRALSSLRIHSLVATACTAIEG
jgi:hypothetical protein